MAKHNNNSKSKSTFPNPDEKKAFDPRSGSGKRGKSKGRRNYNKSKTNSETRDYVSRNGNLESKVNDFSWYNRNPELVAAVARIPFPNRPGMATTLNEADDQFLIPGVLSVEWAPFIGAWTNTNSPVTLASTHVFNKVRAAFSGSIDADSPDFMMYFLALDSIYSYIAYLKRMFRSINAYTPENRQTPAALLDAMGITSRAMRAELREDKMKLYQYINNLVKMTSSFHCPDVFDLFRRHYQLNDNVYRDREESNNAQFYIACQKSFLKYGLNSDGISELTYASPSIAEGSVVDNLYAFGVDLITAMMAHDDTYIISGYLKRAYEGTAVFALDTIDYSEVQNTVYDRLMLSQFENARCPFNSSVTLQLNKIIQYPATNVISTDFRLTVPEVYDERSIYPNLNIRNDNPSVEEVVEASRLHTAINFGAMDNAGIIAGTEIVLAMSIKSGSDNVWSRNVQQNNIITADTTIGEYRHIVRTIGYLSSFDWHPAVYVIDTTNATDAGDNTFKNVIAQDISNLTFTSFEDMQRINDICLLSEFNAYN